MPMPKPGKNESQEDFVKRFMGDETMAKEYPDEKQRYAICMEQWRQKQKNMSMMDIDNVPIFATGTWNGDNYTENDLDQIVTSFDEIGGELKPMIKLGHDEKQILLQKDGYPSAGWITSLRRKAGTLYADFKQIPEKIGQLIKSKAYGRLSSEIFINLKHGEKIYPKALRAVALLGGDTPAVTSLDDFINLYTENDYETIRYFDYEEQTMDAEQIKKFEIEIKEKDDQIKELNAKIDQYKENEKKVFTKNVEDVLNSAIEDGKLTPAQKVEFVSMIDGENKLESFKKFIQEQPKIVDFSEQSKKNEVEKNKQELSDDEKLDQSIKAYIKEHKDVSYKDAYRIVAAEMAENEGGE